MAGVFCIRIAAVSRGEEEEEEDEGEEAWRRPGARGGAVPGGLWDVEEYAEADGREGEVRERERGERERGEREKGGCPDACDT
jgi:hypothetical protein